MRKEVQDPPQDKSVATVYLARRCEVECLEGRQWACLDPSPVAWLSPPATPALISCPVLQYIKCIKIIQLLCIYMSLFQFGKSGSDPHRNAKPNTDPYRREMPDPDSHQTALWNRNYFLRFRFLLLKSYGSGSDL
jgi:hypothetical protein